MKKVMIFSALIMAPIVIALLIWLVPKLLNAQKTAAFSKVGAAKPPLTLAQVESLMGRPAHIEQSETTDQSLNGTVYDYPAHGQDLRVIFVNGTVFKTALIPASKS